MNAEMEQQAKVIADLQEQLEAAKLNLSRQSAPALDADALEMISEAKSLKIKALADGLRKGGLIF